MLFSCVKEMGAFPQIKSAVSFTMSLSQSRKVGEDRKNWEKWY